MNFAALQTFLTVIETGNLNKAADRLNVTQSTITARLDALEETLGQTLLVRSRRGAQLTRAGFRFRPYAEALARSWDQARNAVGLPKGFSGLFSFACEFDLWESSGKRWLNAARAAHPELAFEAWPGSVAEIETWLANGLTDAALTLEPLKAPDFTARELTRERLVQVARAPRAAQPPDPGYVYVDLGSAFRRRHAQVWSEAQTTTIPQTAAMTYASSAWALEHLLKEGGSAYLPWTLVGPEIERGALHLVSEAPEFARSLTLNWRDVSLETFPWIAEMGLAD